MYLNHIDLVVLVVYVAGTVAVGLWVGRKSGSTEEFMAAGRKLPGWAVSGIERLKTNAFQLVS